MTTEQIREVAKNPDGCNDDELQSLVDYIDRGDKPQKMADALWPNQPNRLNAAILIRDYCRRSLKIRGLRLRSQINRAVKLESINEDVYNRLPAWSKW